MYMSEQMHEKTVNDAIASVEMEGYRVTEDEKRICMELIDDRITKEQFIKTVLERYVG